jgi:hypothetical protein
MDFLNRNDVTAYADAAYQYMRGSDVLMAMTLSLSDYADFYRGEPVTVGAAIGFLDSEGTEVIDSVFKDHAMISNMNAALSFSSAIDDYRTWGLIHSRSVLIPVFSVREDPVGILDLESAKDQDVKFDALTIDHVSIRLRLLHALFSEVRLPVYRAVRLVPAYRPVMDRMNALRELRGKDGHSLRIMVTNIGITGFSSILPNFTTEVPSVFAMVWVGLRDDVSGSIITAEPIPGTIALPGGDPTDRAVRIEVSGSDAWCQTLQRLVKYTLASAAVLTLHPRG